MNKTKKSANILAGLDESLVILKTEKVTVSPGKHQIHISVKNPRHDRTCPDCGNRRCRIKDSGDDVWAWHIPQGERVPCKVFYHKEHYLCSSCGRAFTEDIRR